MMLTKIKCAHFNDLKFMFEINFKHNSCNIINNIILCFHDHKNLKKTFSKFIHVINAENFAFLLIDYYSDFIIEIYQDFQKTFSKFTHIIYINNSTFLFYHYDSDSVTEFSFFLMHDNHADTFVIVLASCSCCQYKSAEFVDFTDNFDNMMKLDEFSFIAAISDCSFHDFNAKKQQLNANLHILNKICCCIQFSTQDSINNTLNYDLEFTFSQ